MEPRWIKPFVYSAGGILLAAALIRFVIAAGNAPVLALPEPILCIPLRYAVLLVGAIEAAVALYRLFGRRIALQVGWLAWLAANFVFYRVLLLLFARSSPSHLHRQPDRSTPPLTRNAGVDRDVHPALVPAGQLRCLRELALAGCEGGQCF